MAVILEIIEEEGINTVVVDPGEVAQTIVIPQDIIEIIQPADPTVIEILAGPQGPPGVQNVVVSATEPASPFENMIWIDIS